MENVAPNPDMSINVSLDNVEAKEGLSADSVHQNQIFPNEVWLLVAQSVQKKSSDAAENLKNSSTFFRNLLMSQRHSFLFEKVFDIMAASIWKREGLEGLPVSQILVCRAVCKPWNAAIERLVPQKFEYFGEGRKNSTIEGIGEAFRDIQREHGFSNDIPAAIGGNDNRSNNSVQSFLRHFERTHPGTLNNGKNPWIWSQCITITIYAEDNDDVNDYYGFLDGISVMLSKYGCHLQSLSFVVESDEFFRNSVLVQKWLRQTPNLKTLNFVCESSLPYVPNSYDDERNHRVLRMPKLRLLREIDFSNVPVPFFHQIVSQNIHINSLFLMYKDEAECNLYQYEFPNLQNLHLNGCHPKNFVENFRSSQFQSQVESLELIFDEPFSCAILFKVIQSKVANSLVSLTISFDDPLETASFWQQCKSCRLDLPKLRNVSLDLNINPVCLDFLLPTRLNLEEISASAAYEVPATQNLTYTLGTIVQFVGFEQKMLESNIWVIFKKLNKFEVVHSKEVEPQKFLRCDWELKNVYL